MQGAVAQQGERFNGIEEVRSSILLSSTNINLILEISSDDLIDEFDIFIVGGLEKALEIIP